MIIDFVIPGKPVGKGRPRSGRYSMYTPKTTREYEEHVKACYMYELGGTMFEKDKPIKVSIKAFYPIPKSKPKLIREAMLNNRMIPLIKPDIDNVIKIILDALNGLAYEDDKQVFSVSAEKLYGENPRVVVEIVDIRNQMMNDE